MGEFTSKSGRFIPMTGGRRRCHRVLLYSHDSWGLGHLRRSLTLASALTEAFPTVSALLVTGSPCATQFPVPERVDVVKLPSVTKDQAGNYTPRSLQGSVGQLLDLRGVGARLLILGHHGWEAPDPESPSMKYLM